MDVVNFWKKTRASASYGLENSDVTQCGFSRQMCNSVAKCKRQGGDMSNRIARSLIGVIAPAAAFAQVQVQSEFDVASIRLNTANDRIVTINVGPGGRFAAKGYTLKLLIQRAYGVMGWNISGGPAWSDTDRYDVAATATIPGNLTERQLRPMLQGMLADRFKLRLHEDSKEMSGYALVLAKDGPKVTAAADGEEHPDTFRMNQAGLKGQGLAMEDFARYVAGKLGLVAVDKTGLKGLYDFEAEWTWRRIRTWVCCRVSTRAMKYAQRCLQLCRTSLD